MDRRLTTYEQLKKIPTMAPALRIGEFSLALARGGGQRINPLRGIFAATFFVPVRPAFFSTYRATRLFSLKDNKRKGDGKYFHIAPGNVGKGIKSLEYHFGGIPIIQKEIRSHNEHYLVVDHTLLKDRGENTPGRLYYNPFHIIEDYYKAAADMPRRKHIEQLIYDLYLILEDADYGHRLLRNLTYEFLLTTTFNPLDWLSFPSKNEIARIVGIDFGIYLPDDDVDTYRDQYLNDVIQRRELRKSMRKYLSARKLAILPPHNKVS